MSKEILCKSQATQPVSLSNESGDAQDGQVLGRVGEKRSASLRERTRPAIFGTVIYQIQ